MTQLTPTSRQRTPPQFMTQLTPTNPQFMNLTPMSRQPTNPQFMNLTPMSRQLTSRVTLVVFFH